MDNYVDALLSLNVLFLIVSFILIVVLLFKYSSLYLSVTELNYLVYKPLFPFELKQDDPFHIDMLDKNVSQETVIL